MKIIAFYPLCLVAGTILAVFPARQLCRGDVLINEFVAANQTGLVDEDLAHSDWIELYNNGGTAVSLAGCHLTDDAALPQRWTFPAVSINPGGYLVVFASGKDRAVPGQNLHANFSLSSGGEYLALNAPGGAIHLSEFNPFPAQTADVSYGLLADGVTLSYFNVPTPGAVNDAAAAPADPVRFSLSSRTFNLGSPTIPLSLTLSSLSPAAAIRYTTNRAVPIGEDGIVRAVTVDAATDTLTSAVPHGFAPRDMVQVHAATTFPGNLGQSLNYFVIVTSPTTLKLSETVGGTAVDITSAGAGAITLRRDAAEVAAAVGGTFTAAFHPFTDRDEVRISSTGTLPATLNATTSYYVSLPPATPANRTTFSLSATPGGAAISLADAGTGTLTLRRMPSALYSSALSISYSQRVRARGFEAGRPKGPVTSESYLALDAAAQTFTSNLPIFVLHSWGSAHPSATAPVPATPVEDTKQAVWFVFEPKAADGNLARMTNLPDLVSPAYFERRGSSTFGALKYSMTMGALDEADAGKDVSPLGFASNDDFVLNAPYEFDRSLMHNDLIYRLSNEAGRWAPKTRHVEVFMSVNNDNAAAGSIPAWGYVTGVATSADYYGVYSFQDKIKRGAGRIDIEKLEPADNTAPNVQGGYIFKIDRLDLGDAGVGAAGRSFALVQPKEFTSYPSHLAVATTAQKTYLQGVLNAMFSATTGGSFASASEGYAAHFDVPACIDHHILSTLPKSADAFRLSGYWSKSRYGKLVMGPIFDFDRGMGSTDTRDQNPNTWRGDPPSGTDFGTDYFHNDPTIFTPNYFHMMFQDPNFWMKWIDRLHELRQGTLSAVHVLAVIDEYTELLDPGNAASTPAKRNFLKFTGTPPRNAAAFTGTNGTFRGEAAWLKNWWTSRLSFADGQFSRPPVADPALPSGPLPSPAILALNSPTLATPGAKIYYTTDGTDPRATIDPGSTSITASWVTSATPVKAIVPTLALNNLITTTWRGANEPFDDSAWFASSIGSPNGAGYDNSFTAAGSINYQPFIGVRWNTSTYWGTTPAGINPPGVLPVSASNVMFAGTISGTAYAGNPSCYLRYAFTIPAGGLSGINMVRLRMRYDDGYHAFINGVSLGGKNSQALASLTWNSTTLSAVTHDDTASTFFEDVDVMLNTLPAGTVHEGTNILAVHGMNSATTSSDLVQQAQLLAGLRTSPTSVELNPGAIEYTGSLNITQPTRVFARTRHPYAPSEPTTPGVPGGIGTVPNGSRWSAPLVLHIFPGAVAASPASVRLTEVNYHPSPPTVAEISAGYLNSNDFEFIRITNSGAGPVDLTGIYFSTGVEFTSPEGLQNWLPAGASVVVVENKAAFQSRYGSAFTILGQFKGELDDGGESIVLNDKTGAVIADFTYDDGGAWPARADGGGSLIFGGAGAQSDGGNWTASIDPGGSGVSTYARWQSRYFLPADFAAQNASADLDFDGMNNLGEYAFVTDPRSAASPGPARFWMESGSPDQFVLVRRRGAEDLTFFLESTLDLGGLWVPSGPPGAITNLHDGTESVSWPIPTPRTDQRLFWRVRVTSP